MQGDMRNFEIAAPVDIAAIFMASTGYLLSNDDMVKHLPATRSQRPCSWALVEPSWPKPYYKFSETL